VSFNFVVLKVLSYCMDAEWATEDKGEFEIHRVGCRECDSGVYCYKSRVSRSLDMDEYSLLNYLVYVTYAPLYIAGPIITFNDFTWQMKRKRIGTVDAKKTLIFGLRWAGCLLLMEVMMHLFWVVAIGRTRAWDGVSVGGVCFVGFWGLKFIWLKLLVIWRFFRLWAMADGIETVENMARCMTNNYSCSGFWRSWHRSFNRWLIRYVYGPLGGSQNYGRNFGIVFLFVAVWHDISLTLLAWGWLVCVFVVPEVVAVKIFSRYSKWKYYRHLCAVGGVLNIYMMMIANLVGFAVGLDGMRDILSKIFGSLEGLWFLFGSGIFFFSLVQLMFEVRDHEEAGRY